MNNLGRVRKIYLFGDSICFGQLVSSHKTWPVSLAHELEAFSKPGLHFLLQNAGVNGDTTRKALERLHFDVTSHNPDYVFIQFGMNDCNYWESDRGLPRVSPAAFMANIEEIIYKCVAAGVQHCFINTNHPSAKGMFRHFSEKSYDQSNSEYNEYIRTTAFSLQNRFSVQLIDTESTWKQCLDATSKYQLKDLLLEDGVHLSEQGHELYIKHLVAEIIAEIRARELA